MQNRKRDTNVQNRVLDCGRRRGWDISREQHQNMYIIKEETAPAQVGCMRQVLGPGALGRPEGLGGEGGGRGVGMGNTCKSMANPCQCMTKTTIVL